MEADAAAEEVAASALTAPEVPEVPPPVPTRGMLVFEATLTEPDAAAHFLGTGGPLAAASASSVTSFAVSGDDGDGCNSGARTREPATVVQLYQNMPTLVKIPLSADGTHDVRDKLLIETQVECVGINGTYGRAYAGAAAQFVTVVLKEASEGGALSVSLTYAGRAQDGVVTITKARVEGSAPTFEVQRDVKRTEAAMASIKAYMDRAWDRRTVELPSAEEDLKRLTKVLTKSNVGVHESCYTLVHDNLDVRYPFPLESLEDLFEQALHLNMGPAGQVFAPGEYDELMKDARQGGLGAARHADRIAMAVSQIVCYLMPYRSDGYGYLAPGAPTFVCAESWIRRHASPIHLNDCENGAKLAISMFESIRYDPAVQTGNYPHLRAVYNVIVPYYTWGLSIVGAGGAEASSSESLKKEDGCIVHEHLNGHAIAMLIPTAQLLTALDAGAKAHVINKDKTRHIVERAHQAAYATRFDAMFTDVMVKDHYEPNGEAGWYASRRLLDQEEPDEEIKKIADGLRALPPLAIEGTTPASGYLCGLGAPFGGGDALANGVRLDNCAEAAVGPTIGRCLKMLAAGLMSNRFYQRLCEFHVPCSNPLYADARVRASDVAASQFVFAPMHVGDHGDDVTLHHTGVEVTALKQQAYYAVPLSTFPAEELPDLDYGAAWARRDEMPRDAWTAGDAAFGASPRNTTMYKQNVERLLAINKHFRTTVPPEQTHTLLYLLPLAALVHNAHGVEEFCKRIEATSAFASVEVGEKHQRVGVRGLLETTTPKMPAVFARVYAQFVLE